MRMNASSELPEQGGVQGESEPTGTRDSRARRWAKRLAIFFTGQTLVQGLNLLAGFLLLRWMSPTEYAQYSVANAFHTTLSVFVDLGISGSIVALVGSRGNDPAVVGEYVRCARYYRLRLILVVALASTLVFPLITQNQPWAWGTKVALWASTMAGLFFQVQHLYSAPLLITSRLTEYYRAQLLPSLLRIPAFWVSWLAQILSAPAGTWINALSFALQGLMYKHHAAPAVKEPIRHSEETAKDLWRYVAPLWPNMLWFAIQGQLTIWLMSFLGKTQQIAELAAISRLGVLFGLLGTINSVIVAPVSARASASELPKRYAQLLLLGLGLSLSLILVAALAKPLLLWFIGPQYAHLDTLIFPIVSASSLGLFVSFVVTINTVRKWITWQATAVAVTTVTLAQVIFIWLAPPSTPILAIWFGIATQGAIFLAHGSISIYNLRRLYREARNLHHDEASA